MRRFLFALMLALPMIARAGDSFTAIADRVYASPGGKDLLVDLYIPEGPGPHPAVLVIHGGGWIRGEPADMEHFVDRLTAEGYAVANISYRLAPEHRWPAQFEDCRAALRWLRLQAGGLRIDPERIGVLGYSAGAHLAVMLGVHSPANPAERVTAVVAGAGPYDVRVYENSPYLKKLIGGTPDQYPEAYADASPITKVSPDDAPSFLYHGMHDKLVEVEQSMNMAQALKKQNVPVIFRQEPFGHTLTFLFDDETMTLAMQFFNQYLR